jgi:hypothetical protein
MADVLSWEQALHKLAGVPQEPVVRPGATELLLFPPPESEAAQPFSCPIGPDRQSMLIGALAEKVDQLLLQTGSLRILAAQVIITDVESGGSDESPEVADRSRRRSALQLAQSREEPQAHLAAQILGCLSVLGGTGPRGRDRAPYLATENAVNDRLRIPQQTLEMTLGLRPFSCLKEW